MTCEYADVVTVMTPTCGKKLRVAPFMSGLKVGNRVKIEIECNPFETEGTVEDIATYNTSGEEFRLLRSFVGFARDGITHELDMRVTKRLYYEDLWPEEGGEANG